MNNYSIRKADSSEYATIGKLLVSVYSQLEGFPKKDDQPEYYHTLANIGNLIKSSDIEIIVATDQQNNILGVLVYYGTMKHYGPEEINITEQNTAGLRLLAVSPEAQGQGIGKHLTESCIAKAKLQGCGQIILHSTKAMQTAWNMYERMGFKRSHDLDFMQGSLGVYGFRLLLL
ncbi:GNAT family N-acetyltransferase [Flavobacterium sp. NRK1]|uniref:GNAT family N-acetyltransferase n=1 Tax=Flavobacterium sp. NRK1 TaxID=2954929 RepID=UPI0020920DD4|nr:GNAT family N-acetyltransferase [Flavobacterium sp. NRK1]MCO6146562.1 GNAT family N-acetyltransferase [Flavobacterium sp. NRK1]